MWKGEVYLGHWIGYMPGEERMAISKLDQRRGSVELLHRFTTLSSCTEAALTPDEAMDQPAGIRMFDMLKGGPSAQKEQFRCRPALLCLLFSVTLFWGIPDTQHI